MPKRRKPKPEPQPDKSTPPSGPPINPFPHPQPENAGPVKPAIHIVEEVEPDIEDIEEYKKNHGRLP